MLRVLIVIALVTGAAAADTPKRVERGVAQQHLVKKVDPVVPPIALLAGTGGTVAVDVVISADGSVTSTTLLSGPSVLQTACIEAVRKWKYKPFVENGQAVAVVTKVDCTFRAPSYSSSEESALHDYYPVDNACTNLYSAKNYSDAETKCRAAVLLAEQLPADRMIERSTSYAFLAHTFLSEGKLDDAIPLYQKSLDAYRGVEHSERDADFATDHVNLARAYFLARQFDKADPLYARAIQIYEAAIVALPDMKENYAARMKRAILEYAKLKEVEGDSDAAKSLAEKAAAIP
jgi:TonB family protein